MKGEVNFPTVRQLDGKGGYIELYKCFKHDLVFATQELANIHYAVDHVGKDKRRTGYKA